MNSLADRLRAFVWPPYGLPPEEQDPAEEAPSPDVREEQSAPTEPLQPRNFSEFIGQEEAVRLLRTEVEAAKREGRTLAHILFYGPPGTGKTSLAFVLAAEMGGLPVYESSGAEIPTQKETIETLGRVGRLKEQAGLPVIFLLDEADGMARVASYPLHSLMTSGYVRWQGVTYDCRGTTIVATTNHMARMHRALKSRFQEVVLIDYYDPASLARIAEQSAKRMGIKLGEGVAEWIGLNSAGEPRKTNRRILRGIMNLLNESRTADIETAKEAARLSGLRPRGLSRSQFEFLRFLSMCEKQTSGVNGVAAFLGEDSFDVVGEYEPFLIRSGMVQVTRSGRKLTDAGKTYLEECGGGVGTTKT